MPCKFTLLIKHKRISCIIKEHEVNDQNLKFFMLIKNRYLTIYDERILLP